MKLETDNKANQRNTRDRPQHNDNGGTKGVYHATKCENNRQTSRSYKEEECVDPVHQAQFISESLVRTRVE